MIQTPEHIREFAKRSRIPTIFSWHQILDVPPDIVKIADRKPIAICTSNNFKRDIDMVIPEGHDLDEFYRRDFDEPPIENFLLPVNRFKMIGNYITGYDWKEIVYRLKVDIIGYDRELMKEYDRVTKVEYEKYKRMISTYAGVFQPSSIKARSFVVGESMASGNVIIVRNQRKFKYNPSLLNKSNSIIVSNYDEVTRAYNTVVKEWRENKKELKSIGENAIDTVVTHLNIDNFVEKWESFIEISIS